jgi:hypothetical protein
MYRKHRHIKAIGIVQLQDAPKKKKATEIKKKATILKYFSLYFFAFFLI